MEEPSTQTCSPPGLQKGKHTDADAQPEARKDRGRTGAENQDLTGPAGTERVNMTPNQLIVPVTIVQLARSRF
jgi:hypothetical protein